MKNRVCKLNFHSFGKFKLDTFATGVKVGVYGNPTVFVAVSITESEFIAILTHYNDATADYDTYGKTKKTAYINSKDKLMGSLDLLAGDVNKTAAGDASIIILAGFTPTSDQFQRVTVADKIESMTVKTTSVSGQIIVEATAIKKKAISGYGLICVSGGPLPNDVLNNGIFNFTPTNQQMVFDLSKPRKKVVNGLTPGVQYSVYMYATNSAGVSPLSDARTIWAT